MCPRDLPAVAGRRVLPSLRCWPRHRRRGPHVECQLPAVRDRRGSRERDVRGVPRWDVPERDGPIVLHPLPAQHLQCDHQSDVARGLLAVPTGDARCGEWCIERGRLRVLSHWNVPISGWSGGLLAMSTGHRIATGVEGSIVVLRLRPGPLRVAP